MSRPATRPGMDRASLLDCLARTSETVSEIGTEFVHYARKLTDLSDRFSEGRFHLAVLGQFKRGKSTLLNALTGEPILPMGVVPLTAAPTFMQFGEPLKIKALYHNNRPADEFFGSSTNARNACLEGKGAAAVFRIEQNRLPG